MHGQQNIKKTVALISQTYFWNKTLHTAEPNQFRPDPASRLTANLYDIYHCCVHSEKLLMMDRETAQNM